MRKILILSFMTFFAMVLKAGDVNIVIGDLTWGAENELVVSMNNENDVNGFQFDLFLPDGCYIGDKEKDEVEALPSERLKGMSVMCRALSDGKYRIVVFSLSSTKVKGYEGDILRLPLKSTEKMTKGSYEVRLSNASASVVVNNKMESAKVPNTTSKIIVGR